jgi:MOSC domain-containing protein YiiM
LYIYDTLSTTYLIYRKFMQLLSVNLGAAINIASAERPVMSAIGKRAAKGAHMLRSTGLVGDEQADLTVHGGQDKALYAYPHEHYALWQSMRTQALRPSADEPLPMGAFGENLTLSGVLENALWVGDQLRFPNCVLVVSQPRLPCFKFNINMGFSHAVKMMVQSGTCGFYLSVLEGTSLEAGQTFNVKAGPRELSIPELFEARTRKARQQNLF